MKMTSTLLCVVFGIITMGIIVQSQSVVQFATQDDLQALASKLSSQETKLQSQELKIQSQETKIQSLEAQLKAKQDVTPLIGFRAGFLHDPVPIKYSNGQTIVFDRVYLNDGNAYTAHSGMFRAPVSGLYMFTLDVLPSSPKMELNILKEGKTAAYLVTANTATESIQTVVHLLQDQEVWVTKHWGGDTLRGNQLTTFSGFLLRADHNNSNEGSNIVG